MSVLKNLFGDCMSELPSAAPSLVEDGHRLRLCLPLDAWLAIGLPWRRSRALPATVLRETLSFDFRSGRSFLRLEGPDGKLYECCDLSGCCPRSDPLFESVDRLPALRAALAAAFEARWGGPLPFVADELSAERCVLLCAFIGYDRAFYDAVPVRSGGLAPPRDFRRAARSLHRADRLPALVSGCRLPQMKSVRRQLFSRPALLFYARELPIVREALPDPNCFCALLADRSVFFLLSDLHSYRAAADYYVNLGHSVGSTVLLRLLRENDCNLLMSALRYAAMDARGRRQERRLWQGPYQRLSERCRPLYQEDGLGYSIPIPQETCPAVPPRSASGAFSFERLGSVREFVNAGTALHNCLAELPFFCAGHTVLAVRSGNVFVAAVQLKGRQVIQAFAAHNRPIDPETPLGQAYRAWADRYGLQPPSPAEEFVE